MSRRETGLEAEVKQSYGNLWIGRAVIWIRICMEHVEVLRIVWWDFGGVIHWLCDVLKKFCLQFSFELKELKLKKEVQVLGYWKASKSAISSMGFFLKFFGAKNLSLNRFLYPSRVICHSKNLWLFKLQTDMNWDYSFIFQKLCEASLCLILNLNPN